MNFQRQKRDRAICEYDLRFYPFNLCWREAANDVLNRRQIHVSITLFHSNSFFYLPPQALHIFLTGIFAISGNELLLYSSQKAYSLFCHSMVLSFFVLVHFAAFAGVFSLSFMWQEWLWEHRKLELDEED